MADGALRVRSVVLLSGGLDSAANLAFCALRDEAVLALTCRYGQRAEEREVEASRKICAKYGVPHELVDLRWLGALGGSALTQRGQDVPTLESSQLDDAELTARTAKSVWVPNRNGVLLAAAAAHAERVSARRVVVGFNREEAATFPDNSVDYLRATTRALAFSTANQVEAFSYTAELDKREIVRALRALDVSFPYDAVWSCYHGGTKPCERCESCQRFLRATRTDS